MVTSDAVTILRTALDHARERLDRRVANVGDAIAAAERHLDVLERLTDDLLDRHVRDDRERERLRREVRARLEDHSRLLSLVLDPATGSTAPDPLDPVRVAVTDLRSEGVIRRTQA